MIIDAVVKIKGVSKNVNCVEVYIPRYKFGQPILTISGAYEGRPVKLITGWSDIKTESPVTINGSIIKDDHIGKCVLSRGMFLTSFGDNNVYVVVPETLLK